MLLLVNDKYSLFQSVNQRHNDSIKKHYSNSSLTEKSMYTSIRSESRKTSFRYNILKDKNKVIYRDKPFTNSYIYEEELNFDWKIKEEIKKISNYTCQKATLSFGGRNLIAWFTKEIPINDGPYKFKGLPGLIVNLYDDQNHYIFNLLNVKKNKLNMEFNSDEAIKVSKKDFYADIEDFRERPLQRMIQLGLVIKTENQRQRIKKRGKKFRANELELKIE